MKYQYNPWPLGQIKPEHQRGELQQLKQRGIEFDDPRDVVEMFENKVAEFAGAKHAISVASCTDAISMCLEWWMVQFVESRFPQRFKIGIPNQTYISIYQLLQRQIAFGIDPVLLDVMWTGKYQLAGTNIWDAAVLWDEGMYIPGTLHCISFQIKKPIPIGRGGMILTDDDVAAAAFRLARYDNRDLSIPYDQPEHIRENVLWPRHCYMTPEDAARGLMLMSDITWRGASAGAANYPPISNYKFK